MVKLDKYATFHPEPFMVIVIFNCSDIYNHATISLSSWYGRPAVTGCLVGGYLQLKEGQILWVWDQSMTQKFRVPFKATKNQGYRPGSSSKWEWRTTAQPSFPETGGKPA
jgi:hypothetical protein